MSPILSTHNFVAIIKEWVSSLNIDPQETEQQLEDYAIGWHFRIDGMSFAVIIYLDDEDRPFFWIESTLAKVENRIDFKWLLEKNGSFHGPLKFAIERGFVVIQCQGLCKGFTPEYFDASLKSWILYSDNLRSELKELFSQPS